MDEMATNPEANRTSRLTTNVILNLKLWVLKLSVMGGLMWSFG